MNAWVCPKCGRVWGPMVPHCGPCNTKIRHEEESKGDQLPPMPDPAKGGILYNL